MIVLFVGMGLRPQKTKGPILIFSGLVLLSLPFTYRLWNYAPYYAHVWSQISASPTLGEIIDLFLVKLPFGSFAGRGHDYFRFFLTALSATTLIVAVLIPSPVRNHARLSLLYCLLPATCLLVISETFATVWRDRFLLFCLPYLLFTSTLFLEVLWNKSRVTAWLLFSSILLVQCQGLVQYFNEPLPISWREVAQAIGDRPTPNSAIILTRTPRLAPVFAHYGVVKTPVKLIPVSPEATGFAQLWAEITLLHPNYQRLWLVFEQGIEHASLLNSLAAHLASAAERMPFRIGRHLHGSGISFVELEGTNFHR